MQWILFLETERWEAAFWRRSMCSEKPPWRARTPTVRLIMMKVVLWDIFVSVVVTRCSSKSVMMISQGMKDKAKSDNGEKIGMTLSEP